MNIALALFLSIVFTSCRKDNSVANQIISIPAKTAIPAKDIKDANVKPNRKRTDKSNNNDNNQINRVGIVLAEKIIQKRKMSGKLIVPGQGQYQIINEIDSDGNLLMKYKPIKWITCPTDSFGKEADVSKNSVITEIIPPYGDGSFPDILPPNDDEMLSIAWVSMDDNMNLKVKEVRTISESEPRDSIIKREVAGYESVKRLHIPVKLEDKLDAFTVIAREGKETSLIFILESQQLFRIAVLTDTQRSRLLQELITYNNNTIIPKYVQEYVSLFIHNLNPI